MRYRFEQDMLVEGRTHKCDATVDEKDIPAGCLQSMIGVGAVVAVPDQPPPPQQQQQHKSKTKA